MEKRNIFYHCREFNPDHPVIEPDQAEGNNVTSQSLPLVSEPGVETKTFKILGRSVTYLIVTFCDYF
jgi:hypothetical protein